MGLLCSQIQQFHFLSSTRVEECGGEDIQAQTDLSDCKRGRGSERSLAFVPYEKRDLR